MPCNGGPWPQLQRRDDQIATLRHQVDFLTRHLCSLCALVEERRIHPPLHTDLLAWWEEHKAKDAARRRAEANELRLKRERNRAIRKLTPHERHLLTRFPPTGPGEPIEPEEEA